MIELIMSYIAIWAPALVACLGVLTTICVSISKVTKTIYTIKSDKDFKELRAELKRTQLLMQEQKKTNELLLEKVTNIKDYAKIKDKE